MGNHWELTEIRQLHCDGEGGRLLGDDDEHGQMVENECSRHGDDPKCDPNKSWLEGIHQEMMEIRHDYARGVGGRGMSYLNIRGMDVGDHGVDGKA